MAEKDLQKQIDDINVKLDAILECATAQKLRSARLDDLMEDVNIITKDAFRTTVEELEMQGVELNWDDLKFLGFKLMKNVGKFTFVMDTFESLYDLMQDLGPVANEVIIDMIRKMHEAKEAGHADVTLLGTGSAFREFLYNEDLADAIIYSAILICPLTNSISPTSPKT